MSQSLCRMETDKIVIFCTHLQSCEWEYKVLSNYISPYNMSHRSYCNNYVAHFRAINIFSISLSTTLFFKISRVFKSQHSILLVDKIEIKILRITVQLKLSKKRSVDKICSSQPQRNFKKDAFIFHQKKCALSEKIPSRLSSLYCSRQKIRGSGIRKSLRDRAGGRAELSSARPARPLAEGFGRASSHCLGQPSWPS